MPIDGTWAPVDGIVFVNGADGAALAFKNGAVARPAIAVRRLIFGWLTPAVPRQGEMARGKDLLLCIQIARTHCLLCPKLES